VRAATDASNASVEAIASDINNGAGPARTGSPEPETDAERRAAPLDREAPPQ
jgi:penicillin-binding protein 2